jgi:hypothetical protein
MASKSRKRFDESAADIDTLIDLYEAMVALSKAEGKPIDEGVEVLFRSAVVLMVSHWEAYVEDICSEALEHLVNRMKGASKLPKQIKQQVARDLKAEKNEIAIWQLADDGWKAYLRDRLLIHKEARDRSFNTPRAQSTADFVKMVLGIEDIRTSWTLEGSSPEAVAKKLDALVEVRGQIAHRGRVGSKLDRAFISDHIAFLRKVVSKTGGAINAHLKHITGKGLW